MASASGWWGSHPCKGQGWARWGERQGLGAGPAGQGLQEALGEDTPEGSSTATTTAAMQGLWLRFPRAQNKDRQSCLLKLPAAQPGSLESQPLRDGLALICHAICRNDLHRSHGTVTGQRAVQMHAWQAGTAWCTADCPRPWLQSTRC